jgi:UPF0042 nucleotide-binding protein
VSDQQRFIVHLTSFGHGHGPAPKAQMHFDVRGPFRDPHLRPDLCELTAHDQEVAEVVLATPGVRALVLAISSAVLAYAAGPGAQGAITVAVGCVGGRHRAPVIANEVAYALGVLGIEAVVEHRDLTRPVIAR